MNSGNQETSDRMRLLDPHLIYRGGPAARLVLDGVESVAIKIPPWRHGGVTLMTPLHLLIVENQPMDAELIVRELKKSGYDPAWSGWTHPRHPKGGWRRTSQI